MNRSLHIALLAGLLAAEASSPAWALRANTHRDLDKLEKMGHYEEVLFARMSTRDMVLAVHAAWAGAPYDPRMDGVLGMTETRVDRRFWDIINNQSAPISDLLAKARLTDAQKQRLALRVRVYVEDHLSPQFDEMGNFYFQRKAWAMERMGLLDDAGYRRELTGLYCRRVCAAYYATIAQELARAGDPQADAYRAKADWFSDQTRLQLRRAHGDHLLAAAQPGDKRQARPRAQVVATLKAGLASGEPDARLAAGLALAETGHVDALQPLAADRDVNVRRAVAGAFADALFAPGLAAMADDADPQVKALLADANALAAMGKGLAPGVKARYLRQPDQAQPTAQRVLPAVATGFRGDERWPDKLRPAWDTPDILPDNAGGQFLVAFEGKLAIPQAGRYRFYARTELGNRATVTLVLADGTRRVVLSPRLDRDMRFAVQNDYQGAVIKRIDFSDPIDLPAGLVGLEVEYKGATASGKQGAAGLRLGWSSDRRVMEPIPDAMYFHAAE
ncbi:MAG: hypothetical protein BIFFINMI_02287 [Phycisphaerae bacterium]|nr:hypothetical protein [Phycisphaerae bacterium]